MLFVCGVIFLSFIVKSTELGAFYSFADRVPSNTLSLEKLVVLH